jgi:hypothetical protein
MAMSFAEMLPPLLPFPPVANGEPASSVRVPSEFVRNAETVFGARSCGRGVIVGLNELMLCECTRSDQQHKNTDEPQRLSHEVLRKILGRAKVQTVPSLGSDSDVIAHSSGMRHREEGVI